MEKAKEIIKKYGDKIAFLGCALIILGVFLPLVSIRLEAELFPEVWGGDPVFNLTTERTSMHGVGNMSWVMVIAAVAIAALTYLKKSKKLIGICLGLCAGIIIGLFFSGVVDLMGYMAEALLLATRGIREVAASARWGIGLYVMIAGILITAVHVLFAEEQK